MAPLNTTYLESIFKKLDKNGDGFVSLEELMWFLERLGFHTSQDELKLLVGKTSLDYIEFHFFYDILIKKEKNSSSPSSSSSSNDDISMEKDLEEAFRVFDLNGDGFISSEELQSALSKLGLWDEQSAKSLDCKCMISLYDTNSDGVLDFQEFKNMMLLTRSSL